LSAAASSQAATVAGCGSRRSLARSGGGERMSDLSLWPIGNCQVSALVDGAAGFVWGCAPQVDGDPLFCALLNPKGEAALPRGEWRLSLENQVSAECRYLRNTPILATRL